MILIFFFVTLIAAQQRSNNSGGIGSLQNFGTRGEEYKRELCFLDTTTFSTVRHLVTESLQTYFPNDAAQIVSAKLGTLFGDCWSVVIGRDFSYYVFWMEHDYCFYFDCEWWQAVLIAKQKCPPPKATNDKS